MGKHVVVDQALCNKVLKLHNVGMERKEIAELLGIGRSTVDRIVNADFNAELMARMRREREKKSALDEALQEAKESAVSKIVGQTVLIQGEKGKPAQLAMDLGEKKPKDYQEALTMFCAEAGLDDRDKKLMRFEAGQVEKICTLLSRIDDRLAMLLRRMDNAGTRDIQRPAESQKNAEEKRSGY